MKEFGNSSPQYADLIIVESDCKVVVDRFNGSSMDYSPLGAVMASLKAFIQRSTTCVKFDFVSREANKAAHGLAKIGITLDSDVQWTTMVPPQIVKIVQSEWISSVYVNERSFL